MAKEDYDYHGSSRERSDMPMTPDQEIGRKCTIILIVIAAAFDVFTKLASFLVHGFQVSYLTGSVLTAVLLFFLWRGAKAAWWIMTICMSLALLLCLAMATRLPWYGTVILVAIIWTMGVLLVIPPTRDFLAYQRSKMSNNFP